MGLDMYLYAEEYVSPYWNEDRYNTMTKAVGSDKLRTLNYLMIQWRKANHIHNWFVRNVQYNDDNCKRHWVSRDQLRDLQRDCKVVLDQHDDEVSKQVLPTASGFFFGGTEYGDMYYEDTQFTYDELTKLLDDDDEDLEYYYDSSW